MPTRAVCRRALPWIVALVATSAWAQGAAPPAWPGKLLKIIVGFPAGSSPDLTARLLPEPLSKALTRIFRK